MMYTFKPGSRNHAAWQQVLQIIRLGNKFVQFFQRALFKQKTIIITINYVFTITVYDLFPSLDQFVDAIVSKIAQSGVKEVIEPVFEVLFTVEGNNPHLV